MSSKMDRAGVRTPAQLEQKYALGKLDKSFAEVLGIAEDARTTAGEASTTAGEAKKKAEEIDKNLDHEEIFNRLTENGAIQGLHEENGNFYFNGEYVYALEKLFAKDIVMSGTFTNTADAFLEPGEQELETIRQHNLGNITISDTLKPLYDFNNDGVIDATDLLACQKAVSGYQSLSTWSGAKNSTVTITINMQNPEKAICITGKNMWGRDVESYIGVNFTSIKNPNTEQRLRSLESFAHTSQMQFKQSNGGANYETVIDNWDSLPNRSTWSCMITASANPFGAAAFGYRFDNHGYFTFFDYENATAKFVLVQAPDGVPIAANVREV